MVSLGLRSSFFEGCYTSLLCSGRTEPSTTVQRGSMSEHTHDNGFAETARSGDLGYTG